MKNQISFKYKGKTYYGEKVADGVTNYINDEIVRIGIDHFKLKTLHLADKIKSEGGTINVELKDSKLKFSFDGFSSELVDQIHLALS